MRKGKKGVVGDEKGREGCPSNRGLWIRQWRRGARVGHPDTSYLYFNPFTLTAAMWIHPVSNRVKPSFVVFDIRAL